MPYSFSLKFKFELFDYLGYAFSGENPFTFPEIEIILETVHSQLSYINIFKNVSRIL